MLTEDERRLVIRYCHYPYISIVSLAVAFLIGGPFLILEMIDDLVFFDKGFIGTGLYIYIGIVIIYMIIFCWCMISVKFGMLGKKWKALQHRLSIEQQMRNGEFSQRAAWINAERFAGDKMRKSDNPTINRTGKMAEFDSVLDTAVLALDMTTDQLMKAEEIAKAYYVHVPSIKKQLAAYAIIPVLVLILAYIPQYVTANNIKNTNAEMASERINAVKEVFESCSYISADDPFDNYSTYGYHLTAYLRGIGDNQPASYVSIQFSAQGVITQVMYTEEIDIDLTQEENINKIQADFASLHEMFSQAICPAASDDLMTVNQLADEFVYVFENGTYYDDISINGDTENTDITYDFETDEEEEFDEYSDPRVYIYISTLYR